MSESSGTPSQHLDLYRGVFFHAGDRRHRAKLKHAGKHLFLGNYEKPEDAALVWDAAARLVRGRYTDVNFPGEFPDWAKLEALRRLNAAGILPPENPPNEAPQVGPLTTTAGDKDAPY